MINVAILGSTGSIGTQTLEVIAANPQLFRLSAVAAHSNHRLLRQQIHQFHPDLAVLADETSGNQFMAEGIPDGLDFRIGPAALLEAAAYPEADVVL
ncbi:MAG: dxr, partial [Firmicutes bacterium]|nr:dxr [Bacillota bacterium]